jgi:Domain of unknown function (DUF4214)/Calx-beta domain
VVFSWFSIRRNSKTSASKDLAKKYTFKPRMEQLEDRLTPTAGVSVLQFHISPPSGAPNFTFGGTDYTTVEPTSGISELTVTVDRTTDPGDTVALNTTVSAQFATVDESAIAGTNYTQTSGTVTILGGQTSATFTVDILNVPPSQDGSLQGNKVFGIGLTSPSAEATINPLGSSTAVTIKDSSGTQNQRFVNAAFFELLNRPADTGALQFFAGELDGGTSTGVIVLQIETAVNATGRSEFNDNTINNVFQEFLGRNADLGALNAFGAQLTAGTSIQTIKAEVMSSDEYFANAGGTNNTFVEAMYRDIVNRNADPGGEAFWVSQLTTPSSAGSRLNVLNSFLAQTEAVQDLVTNFYTIYLNRGPDTGGFNFYTGELQSAVPLQTVINQFLTSTPEYFNQLAT